MLSVEQDTIAITTWLLKIISTGVPILRVTVCDFSQASDITIVFAQKYDLRDYLQSYDIII